jgi:uncharacterized protein YfeS
MKKFLFDLKNVWIYGLFREAQIKLTHNEDESSHTLTCRGKLNDIETILYHIANDNNIPFKSDDGYKQLKRLKKICKIKQNS